MNSVLKNKNIYVIFSITLIAVMGVASLTPAFPGIAKSLHLSKSQVGLLISVFTLLGIILTPVTGVIADRIGRKKVLVPSLMLFALAGFACFWFHKFAYLLIFRFIQGIGASSLGSLNTTLIGDFFKGKERPAAMGYNASMLSFSTAFYPLIGGGLAAIAWNYPFLLPLLALPVGFVVIFILDEPEIDRTASLSIYLKSIGKSIKRKEVIVVFILGILTFIMLYGAYLAYIPFILNQRFNLESSYIGMVLSLSSITAAIVASQVGKLTTKFGNIALLKTAFILYFVINILIPNIYNFYLFFIPVLMFGTAQALNMPSIQTIVANLAPDNLRGIFMSINGMVLRIGQTIGPLVISIGYAIGGLEGAYYCAAVVAVTGFLLITFLLDKEKIKPHES
ncbi:MAG: MFS transporter [Marinilabiliales bacterium]